MGAIGNHVFERRFSTGKKISVKANIRSLSQQCQLQQEELERLRHLLEDRTYRMAIRLARLEGNSPCVQCQDGW